MGVHFSELHIRAYHRTSFRHLSGEQWLQCSMMSHMGLIFCPRGISAGYISSLVPPLSRSRRCVCRICAPSHIYSQALGSRFGLAEPQLHALSHQISLRVPNIPTWYHYGSRILRSLTTVDSSLSDHPHSQLSTK